MDFFRCPFRIHNNNLAWNVMNKLLILYIKFLEIFKTYTRVSSLMPDLNMLKGFLRAFIKIDVEIWIPCIFVIKIGICLILAWSYKPLFSKHWPEHVPRTHEAALEQHVCSSLFRGLKRPENNHMKQECPSFWVIIKLLERPVINWFALNFPSFLFKQTKLRCFA